MSAKDTLRRFKTNIQTCLCGDYRLILNKVQEKDLITQREYNNLKSINKEDVEGHVVELVDKIMNKGETRCQNFLNLLQTDEDIKTTFPELKNIQLNDTQLLPKTTQACSSENNDVLSPESKTQKWTALDLFTEKKKADIPSKTKLYELHALLKEVDLAQIVQSYMGASVDRPTNRQLPPGYNETALDLFTEKKKADIPSKTKLYELHALLKEVDLAQIVQRYMGDSQPVDRPTNRQLPPGYDEMDYYTMSHKPRGLCVVINNEKFLGSELRYRKGTQEDAKALRSVFERLGFAVVIYNDLPAARIRHELGELGRGTFLDHDALVVCVLSHGEKECVFGIDGKKVTLRELTRPFTSGNAPTLAGKPKLFFIQACQIDGSNMQCHGNCFQEGFVSCPPRPEKGDRQTLLEEDAGPVRGEMVATDADFLLGMATVPGCRTFRNTLTGSIYIQELCRQLIRSAESSDLDDILTVLTRVNREVTKGEYRTYKQMPQPQYTLTKKLILKFV